MSDDTPITKRLHISGLTPSITPSDLSQKLGSFGTVTALDGFGKLDALGRPRKFGYVTIETTKTKLARCELWCSFRRFGEELGEVGMQDVNGLMVWIWCRYEFA